MCSVLMSYFSTAPVFGREPSKKPTRLNLIDKITEVSSKSNPFIMSSKISGILWLPDERVESVASNQHVPLANIDQITPVQHPSMQNLRVDTVACK